MTVSYTEGVIRPCCAFNGRVVTFENVELVDYFLLNYKNF